MCWVDRRPKYSNEVQIKVSELSVFGNKTKLNYTVNIKIPEGYPHRLFAETSQAKQHHCDVILHAAVKVGYGLQREACQGEGEGPSGWKEGSFIANILFIFMVDLIEKHTVVVEEQIGNMQMQL